MYTQCPECRTIFRVTAEDLKIAGGNVRCGHCTRVFSAIGVLFESLTAVKTTGGGDQDDAPARAESGYETSFNENLGGVIDDIDLERLPSGPESIADDALSLIDELAQALEAGADSDRGAATENITQSPEKDRKTAQWEDIFQASATAGRPDQSADDEGKVWPPPVHPMVLVEDKAAGTCAGARLRRPQWAIAAGVLTLLLGLQWIHFNRFQLVAQPTLGPSVQAAYSFLGLQLTPAGEITEYEIRHWGAFATSGDIPQLTVRTQLTNTATFRQPFPLIRLVVEDRWADRVGMRDFEPHEYLPQNHTARKFLRPNERIEADISVVDPGPDARSFKIDVCLRNDRGTIVCAEDFGRDQTLVGSNL